MNVLVPFGTRPEVIKLAPVVAELRARADLFDVRTVATGQQAWLTDSWEGLEADEQWVLDATDEAGRVGELLTRAYREVERTRPDVVLLLGDTHTVPLFALAARRHRTPIVHLEAGLRSFNETSMEEVDRRVAAATASLHLAPTELAARFLRDEGIAPERIRVVGNPIIDALRAAGVGRARGGRDGIVVTAHRATNVDDPARLARLVELLVALARDHGTVTFPVHPRTRARLEEAGALSTLAAAHVTLLPPLAWRDMVERVAGARVVVTDSGGLQEEASWLGVPVVVLRRSTPRWEGVAAGTSVLTGLDVDRALDAARTFTRDDEQARVAAVPCPYGDGHTAERVADLLADPTARDLLRIREPDFVGAVA